MRAPDDKRRRNPVDRFRKILSAEKEGDKAPAARKAPLLNLPKADTALGAQPAQALAPPREPPAPRRAEAGRFLPTFWTVASIISLGVNAILLVVLITVMRELGSADVSVLGPRTLAGLYTNFERMDQAHIKTTIPIQTSIPLNMTVPVQTTTKITLAQAVAIQGAHVTINTALFNIDAPANVTLPAGTSLDVVLNFNLPVQTDVPVTLNVPVDIAMHDTDLHQAIAGLQDTIRPLYCIVAPGARGLTGQPVCK